MVSLAIIGENFLRATPQAISQFYHKSNFLIVVFNGGNTIQ